MEQVSEIQTKSVSLWKNKNFLLLYTGSTLSTFSFHLLTLALPLIIYDLTKSSFAMSAMKAVEFLPNLLLAIFIGAVVDRSNKKKVLYSSTIIMIVIVSTITYTVHNDQVNLYVLYILGFILHSALYTNGNTYHTVLPRIVTKEQLTGANSLIGLINSVLNVGGPALAGIVLFSASYTVGLSITLSGLVILLVFSLFLNIPQNNKTLNSSENKNILHDVREGLSNLLANKNLWNLTLIVLLSNIVASISLAVIYFYALDYLYLTEYTIGILYSSIALGSVLAAILAKKSKNIGRGKVFFAAIFIEMFCYLFLFLSDTWITVAIALFIKGFSSGLINIHYFTLRQETTPNELLGRVAGTSSMMMKLALPFSYLSSGILAEIINVTYLFLISSILSCFLVFFTKSRGIISIK